MRSKSKSAAEALERPLDACPPMAIGIATPPVVGAAVQIIRTDRSGASDLREIIHSVSISMEAVIDLTRETVVIDDDDDDDNDDDDDDELIILEEEDDPPVAAPVRLARLNSPYSVPPACPSPSAASSKRSPAAAASFSTTTTTTTTSSSSFSSSSAPVLPPLRAAPPMPRSFASAATTLPLAAPALGKRKLSASFFAPARYSSKRPATPSPSASASSPSAYISFDFFPKDKGLLQSKQAQLFAEARLRAQKKAVVQLPVWYTNAEAASTTDDDRRQACSWLAQHRDSAEKCLLVQPNCSQKVVQKHFRTLSVLVHPDKCKEKEAAAEAFKILNKSKEVLLSRCRPGGES